MISKLVLMIYYSFFLIKSVSSSQITIKFKEAGIHSILFNDFQRKKSGGRYPDEIKFQNGSKINFTDYSINLNSQDEKTIILVWEGELNSTNDMFHDCVNITEIDLSEFDSSKVTRMSSMFENCRALISINFGNFNSSIIVGMGSLFKNCISLKSLDLSKFDTQNLVYMNEMFSNCTDLKSLDLSSFITPNLNSLNSIFINCSSLISLNFPNLSMINVNKTINMFYNCKDLRYINLENYDEMSSILLDYSNIFDTTSNLSICFNQTKNPNLTSFINENKYIIGINYYCFHNLDNTELSMHNSYMIENTNPMETQKILESISTYESQNINPEKCECELNCDIENFLINECKNIIIKGNKTNLISLFLKEISNGKIQKLLKSRSNIVFTNENNLHQTSKYSFQKKNLNLSSLDLGECETIIKNKTNINDTEDLYLYIIEHNLEEINIPILEYVLFTENEDNIIVNLSICDNVNIQYQIPVSINEEEKDKYDPSSDFYNDECNSYSNNDSLDITLYDRKNDYNEHNMALCEKDCQYNKYNTETKKAECDCHIKKEISFSKDAVDQNELVGKITDNEKKITNLQVTQCVNVFSSNEQIKSNSGFFTLLLILVIFLIVFIIFCVKGKKMLENKIDDIIYTNFEKNQDLNKRKSDLNNNRNKNKTIININNNNNKKNGKNPKYKKLKNQSKINLNQMINNQTSGKVNTNKRNLQKLRTSEVSSLNKKKEKSIKNKKIPELNDYELNILPYIEAINYDKRSGCEYYGALIKNKQLFLFTFCTFNDYNSGVIKKFIFFLSFALHFTINALFFNDSNMHQIYEDEGSFNFPYQFPYIIISSVASTLILRLILETLVLTERSIVKIKKQNSYESAVNMKGILMRNINIKFAFFFAVNFVLLVAFWYYLTCFSAIYNNTQIYLIENTFISFGISLFFPLIYNIIPTGLRRCALSSEKKDSNYLYIFSQIMQII